MKRLAPIVIGVLALTGCSEEETQALAGNLRQPGAAAVLGEQLFVASLPEDALKVVDLDGEIFVRAPNPLFPLQIPSVRRPDGLATFEAGEGHRALVATVSTIDQELRFVDAEALAPLGATIALPGRPLDVVADPAGELLYVAVEAPLDLDAPAALVVLRLTAAALDPAGEVPADASPAESVAVHPLDARPLGMAATRRGEVTTIWLSDATAPEMVRLDPSDGTHERIPVGSPAGRLLASPAAPGLELEAGAFVYALTAAGDGLLAVDTEAGALVTSLIADGVGFAAPLPARGAGLAVLPEAGVVLTSDDEERRFTVPLLVLVPLIDGTVAYVHGTRMAVLQADGDFDLEPSFTVTPPVVPGDAVDTSAPVLVTETVDGEELAAVELTPGVSRSRTWTVAFEPAIPGHTDLQGGLQTAGDTRIVPVRLPADPAAVRAGDRVEITGWTAPTGSACSAFEAAGALVWRVSSVDATDGALTLATVQDGPPLPFTDCFPAPFSYTVQADGYLVTATGLDEFFRLAPGETFTYAGERFAAAGTDGPEISFTLSADQDEAAMEPGAARTLSVDAGDVARVLSVRAQLSDTSGLGLTDPQTWIPGRPAIRKDADAGSSSGRLYLPYAGGGFVVVIDVGLGRVVRLLI